MEQNTPKKRGRVENLVTYNASHADNVARGYEYQRKGLETRKRNREQQESLKELYTSIAKSKAVKKLVPENVIEYAKSQGIELDNRRAMSIVQVLKAIQGDTESYKLILSITGEGSDQAIKDNQISTLDAQQFLTEVSRILSKWITDKDLLHAIVVDIQHIKLT